MTFPGDKSKELISVMEQLGVMQTRPFAIDLEKSNGMYLKTLDGQDIFDWSGYYGSKLLGHNHSCYFEPEYEKKILLAARNKIANPDFVTQMLVDYYKFLHKNAPKCIANPKMKIYTVNSGAEAVENAVKYCIYKHNKKNLGNTDTKFICFKNAFHGRTLYALNLTDMPYDKAATEPFRNAIPSPLRLDFPVSEEQVEACLWSARVLMEQFPDSIAGLIAEPMLGAGGNLVAPDGFFSKLSSLCNIFDIPIIFDEVQTSGGQTGSMWLTEQFNLPYMPDCIVSAKKFGCGVIYMKEELEEEVLDSTWSGNLVDMVRVPQEFSVVENDKLIERVPEKTMVLVEGLQRLKLKYLNIISHVHGIGLYQGFSVAHFGTLESQKEMRNKIISILLNKHNTLVLGAGEYSIRIRPPLTVSVIDIAQFINKLDLALSDM